MAIPGSNGSLLRGGLAAITAAGLSLAATAQDVRSAADPLDPLRACRSIAADAARLACFDRASSALVAAAEQGDLSVVNREEVRKTRRKLFGFSLPDLGIFGRNDKAREKDAADEIKILNTTIARVRNTRDGMEIVTAEGAVWQIDNPPRRLMTPKPGQPVEFRKGSLSSYFIRINGQGGVKGRRVG